MENQVQAKKPVNHAINTEEDQELNYWSNEFGISKDELSQAVKEGQKPSKVVEKYVKNVQLFA